MTLSKTIVSAGIVTAVAVGSFAAVGAANAHSSANRETLIDRIAEDTGSDPATIEASFQAHREEMKAEREAERQAHLDSLVEEGVLTQDQRDELESRFEDMKNTIQELRDQDVGREEIKSAMEELEAWAEEQGIDLDEVKPEHGHGKFRKHRMGHFMNDGDHETSESEDSDDSEDSDVDES